MSMKVHWSLAAALSSVAWAATASAAVLVNDTWIDGQRTDPAAPTYSEAGVDADADGDIESVWYNGGASTMTASAGHLNKDLTGTSANWTTYFVPEGSEVALANNGDTLRVTWTFTLTGVAAANGSQNFRIGLVDSSTTQRLAADGTPPSGTALAPYSGYAIFANMGVTLGNSNPFVVKERVAQGGSNSILGTANDWAEAALTGTVNGATSGNDGFDAGTPYTLVWELTRNGAGIDIRATMSGVGYNNSGVGTIAANDANGNGFTFDTFNVRPGSEAGSASVVDTTLFRVEFIGVPEPASAALLGMAAVGLLAARRRRSV